MLSSSIPSVVRKAQRMGQGQRGLEAGVGGGDKGPEVRKGIAPPMSRKGRPVRLECWRTRHPKEKCIMGAAEILLWASGAPKGFEGDAGLSDAVPKAACIFSRMAALSGPHTQLLHGWLVAQRASGATSLCLDHCACI